MKHKKIFLVIVVFALLFVYITNIDTIPDNVVLFQNQKYGLNFLDGIQVEGNNVSVIDRIVGNLADINTNIIGEENIRFSLFGGLFEKNVTVSVIPTTNVIPCGTPIGIKMYTKGVLVVGKNETTETNVKNSEIKSGDIIVEANGVLIEEVEELSSIVNSLNGGEISLKFKRDGRTFTTQILPVVSSEDGKYKLGLWVRDGTLGVGTLTFYEPESKTFATLGHGISDVDTKELIDLDYGTLHETSIISVVKGQKSKPGEIRGILTNNGEVGKILLNTACGVYGKILDGSNITYSSSIPVASRNEINIGRAEIICSIDSNTPKKYEIEIEKINQLTTNDTKGMIIRVTDTELVELTGGIIQGMSGTPIIQNGKFIGAITHVFVNDPTRGYAIFGDTMINESRKLLQ